MRRLPLALVPLLLVLVACDSSKKAPPPSPAESSAMAGGQMPPGHPPISGLPQGHPPMGGQMGGQMGSMPMGEPMGAAADPPVAWTTPDGWTQGTPANAMRIAQFALAGDGEGAVPVECVIFGGIGGTAQQNVARWVGQFTAPDGGSAEAAASITQMESNGLSITCLDVSGQYGGGMSADGHSGGEGYRMLAAVVEGAAGPVQVKLVGPAGTVARNAQGFHDLLKSLRPAN